MSDLELLKTDIIPQTETHTEIRMTDTYNDYEFKEDNINQDEDKNAKENELHDPIRSMAKNNNHINFKVIKNKNKQLKEISSTNSDADEKKKELEVLLDNFNMNIRKKKCAENYIELLIG
jgi:hypothetical protein